MRTREKVLSSSNVSASLVDQLNNATYNETLEDKHTQTITDCVTPGYHATLRRGGVLPYLPATIHDWERTHTPEYHSVRRKSDSKREVGTQFLSTPYVVDNSVLPAPNLDMISYVTNAAIADAKSSVYDLLTSMAEIGKTREMMFNRAKSVLDIGKRTAEKTDRRMRRRPATGGRFAAEWANEWAHRFNGYWLEARYGWRPLVGEISNGVQYIQERTTEDRMNRSRAKAEEDISASVTQLNLYTLRNIYSESARAGTRVYRGYALALGDFNKLPQVQPVTTAWELVPFSFVIDWFVDIGSFLQASTPIPGLDIRASGYSIKTEYEIERTWISQASSSSLFAFESATQGRYWAKHEKYERTPSGVMVPRLYPRLNTLRTLDLLSLVFQIGGPIVARLGRKALNLRK